MSAAATLSCMPDPLCLLLGAWVLLCDPAAQQYAEAASRVPAEHWRLVKWVGIQAAPDATADNHGSIVLPIERDDGALFHEVGHQVAFAHDNELGDLWALLFWFEGKPRYRLPSSYARTSPAEDCAESYRSFIEGRLERCRPERAR